MSRSRRARLLQAAAVRPRKNNRVQRNNRIRSASDFLKTPPEPENTNSNSSKMPRQQFSKRCAINSSSKRSNNIHNLPLATDNKGPFRVQRFRPIKRNRGQVGHPNATVTKQKTVPPLEKSQVSRAGQLQVLSKIEHPPTRRSRKFEGSYVPVTYESLTRDPNCSSEEQLLKSSKRVIANGPRYASSSNADAVGLKPEIRKTVHGLTNSSVAHASYENKNLGESGNVLDMTEISTRESRSLTRADVASRVKKPAISTGKPNVKSDSCFQLHQRANPILTRPVNKVFISSNRDKNPPAIVNTKSAPIIYQPVDKKQLHPVVSDTKKHQNEAKASPLANTCASKTNSVPIGVNKEVRCLVEASATKADMREPSKLKLRKRVSWAPGTTSPPPSNRKHRGIIGTKTKTSFAQSELPTAAASTVLAENRNQDGRNTKRQPSKTTRLFTAQDVGHEACVTDTSDSSVDTVKSIEAEGVQPLVGNAVAMDNNEHNAVAASVITTTEHKNIESDPNRVWINPPFRRSKCDYKRGGGVYFNEAQVQGTVYRIGDFVLVMVKPRTSKSQKHKNGKKRRRLKKKQSKVPSPESRTDVGQIVCLWEGFPRGHKESKWMEVRWFCKSNQLPPHCLAGQMHQAHERELFATTLTSINPISSIAGHAQVTLVHTDETKMHFLYSLRDANAFVCRWRVRDDGLFFQVNVAQFKDQAKSCSKQLRLLETGTTASNHQEIKKSGGKPPRMKKAKCRAGKRKKGNIKISASGRGTANSSRPVVSTSSTKNRWGPQSMWAYDNSDDSSSSSDESSSSYESSGEAEADNPNTFSKKDRVQVKHGMDLFAPWRGAVIEHYNEDGSYRIKFDSDGLVQLSGSGEIRLMLAERSKVALPEPHMKDSVPEMMIRFQLPFLEHYFEDQAHLDQYGDLLDKTTQLHNGESWLQMSRFLEFIYNIHKTTAPHLGAGDTTSFFIPRKGPDCRRVWSCGTSENGALGLGSISWQPTPYDIEDVMQVAAGSASTALLLTDGRVMTMGQYTAGRQETVHRPTLIRGLFRKWGRVVQVEVGKKGMIMLTATHRVLTCGYNAGLFPREIASVRKNQVTRIAAGSNFGLLLTATGQVLSWGKGDKGQLGNGSLENKEHPERVEASQLCINTTYLAFALVERLPPNQAVVFHRKENIVAISAGDFHSIFLSNTGQVYACGMGANGRLGLGNEASSPTSMPIENIVLDKGDRIVQISAGSEHSCLRSLFGRVFCMGSARHGQLGLGDVSHRYRPSEILSISPKTLIRDRVVEVQAGSAHTLFLTCNDRVFGCGRGQGGTLGLDTRRDILIPIEIRISRYMNS